MLEPTDGLLERLAEFFEAAAEKTKDSELDDAFDLHDDLQDAAETLRHLGEDLHLAVDQMRALGAPPRRSWRAEFAAHYSAVAARAPVFPKPGRSR
ncbi:hypothetical protein [Streptomyces sp. NPDC059928]|uniref:hypothetical protein n=1 Tax=unclassified Streptomyces TaxID=2593676 RepID=UPI00364E2E78